MPGFSRRRLFHFAGMALAWTTGLLSLTSNPRRQQIGTAAMSTPDDIFQTEEALRGVDASAPPSGQTPSVKYTRAQHFVGTQGNSGAILNQVGIVESDPAVTSSQLAATTQVRSLIGTRDSRDTLLRDRLSTVDGQWSSVNQQIPPLQLEMDALVEERDQLLAELAALGDVFPPTLPLKPPPFVLPADAVFLSEFSGTASERFDAAFAATANGGVVCVPPGDWRITKPIPVRDGSAYVVSADPGPNFAMFPPVPARIICDFTGPVFNAPGSLMEFAAHNLTIIGNTRAWLWDQPSSAVLSAAWFHSIALYGTTGGIGNDTRSIGGYQVLLDGHWQGHGFRQTPFRIRGSEWFTQGFLNLDSPTDVAGNGRPIFWCDNLEKSHLLGVYITARNGWSPFRHSGGADRGLNHLTHSVLEGYKAHTPATAPIKMEGGALDLSHVNVNYFGSPCPAMIDHTGGHLILGPGIGSKLADSAPNMPLLRAAGGTREIIGTPVRYADGRWQPTPP